jgi:hypothetical protein
MPPATGMSGALVIQPQSAWGWKVIQIRISTFQDLRNRRHKWRRNGLFDQR